MGRPAPHLLRLAFFVEIFARFFGLSQVALHSVNVDTPNDLGQFRLFFEEAWIIQFGFYLLTEIRQPSGAGERGALSPS
jgi:hypothetical protein